MGCLDGHEKKKGEEGRGTESVGREGRVFQVCQRGGFVSGSTKNQQTGGGKRGGGKDKDFKQQHGKRNVEQECPTQGGGRGVWRKENNCLQEGKKSKTKALFPKDVIEET